MKKVVLCAVFVSLMLICGCVNREARQTAEKTREAIAVGDYKAALESGELAITQGYKDEDFVELVEGLRSYRNAKTALESYDIKKAKMYLKKIKTSEEDGMQNAVAELEDDIAVVESKIKKNDPKIKNLQNALDNENYIYVITGAESLAVTQYVSKEQKAEISDIRKKALAEIKKISENKSQMDKDIVGVYLLMYDQRKGEERQSTADRINRGMKMTAYFFDDGRGYTIPGAGIQEFIWGNGVVDYVNRKYTYSFIDDYLVLEAVDDGFRSWYQRIDEELGEYPVITEAELP